MLTKKKAQAWDSNCYEVRVAPPMPRPQFCNFNRELYRVGKVLIQ